MNNTHIKYIDLLRIMATIAVIATHISTAEMDSLAYNSTDWHIHNFYTSASRWCVPIFVMVSGALFCDKQKSLNLRRLYNKNILRIFTSIITWSFLYALFQYYTIDKYHNISSLVGLTIIGHYHMWFLYMIIGIYLVLPIYKYISEKTKTLQYFLITSFIFVFILPTCINATGIILPNKIWQAITSHPNFYNTLISNYQHISPKLLLGYSFYFLLGHYLNSITLSKKVYNYIFVGGAIGFIYIATFTFVSSSNEQICKDYYHYLSIGCFLEAVSIFCIIKTHCGKIRYNIPPILIGTSFGTYLLHPMIIETLQTYFKIPHYITPLLSIPLFVITIYIISMLIISLLLRIPIFNKYCL